MVRRKNNILSIIVLTLMLVYTVYRYYNTSYGEIDRAGLSLTVAMAFCSIFVYSIGEANLPIFKGNFLNITLIVAIGMLIVHFFEYLTWLLNLREALRGTMHRVFDSNIVNIAAQASLIGLLSFLLGSITVSKPYTMKASESMKTDMKAVFDIVLFILVSVFFLSTDPRYFSGGYGEIDLDSQSMLSTLADAMIQGCFLARIVNTTYHSKVRGIKSYLYSFSMLFYISSCSYLLGILLSGDRGPIIYMSMMYICGYFIMSSRKLSIKLAVVGFILAALSLTMLSAIRQQGSGGLSYEKIEAGISSSKSGYEDVGYFAFVDDLTRCYRAYNVLFTYGYDRGVFYGVGFANQILGFVPGLRFVVYRSFGIDDAKVNTTILATELMVAQMGTDSISSATGSGFGTTCFGDVYINFGLTGLVVIFFIFGHVVKKLNLSLYSVEVSPLIKIFAIAYFAYAIYIGRSTVFSPVKACAYACYFYYFFGWIIPTSHKKIKKVERK